MYFIMLLELQNHKYNLKLNIYVPTERIQNHTLWQFIKNLNPILSISFHVSYLLQDTFLLYLYFIFLFSHSQQHKEYLQIIKF